MAFNDTDYVDAWKSGGSKAVNDLLRERCSDNDESLVRELQRLDDVGTWDILWHTSSDTGELDFGVVREYLGA